MCFTHQTSIRNTLYLSISLFGLSAFHSAVCACECDANKFDLMHLHISLNEQGDHRISVRRNSSGGGDSSHNSFFPLLHSNFNSDWFSLRRLLRTCTQLHSLKRKKNLLKIIKCNKEERERARECTIVRSVSSAFCTNMVYVWRASTAIPPASQSIGINISVCKLKWLPTTT